MTTYPHRHPDRDTEQDTRMSDDANPVPDRALTVLEAHPYSECPDRARCWARGIHDQYDPEVVESRRTSSNNAPGVSS